jgi:hypothetical protein
VRPNASRRWPHKAPKLAKSKLNRTAVEPIEGRQDTRRGPAPLAIEQAEISFRGMPPLNREEQARPVHFVCNEDRQRSRRSSLGPPPLRRQVADADCAHSACLTTTLGLRASRTAWTLAQKKGAARRRLPELFLRLAAAYQMRARCSGGMYIVSPGFTPKAWYQASTLRSGPSTRKRPGLCGSVVTWLRRASARCFSRHTWA